MNLDPLSELWDIEWYYKISIYGYFSKKVMAFFPLIPILIKFFNIFGIPLIGVSLLNNFLCYLTGILFFNISDSIYKNDIEASKFILFIWLFSPIRVYTIVPYTESLFIFLCTLSFYLYKKRMNPYILGITIGLSVMTRNVGSIWFFVLFIMFVIDFLKNNKKEKIMYIIKTYIPATIISCLYPLYLQLKFGDWKLFMTSQYEYWNKVKTFNIFEPLIYDLKLFFSKTDFFSFYVILTIIFTFTTLFIVLYFLFHSIKVERFQKIELILFLCGTLIICLTTYKVYPTDAATCSFYRYIFGIFSIYLLPHKLNKKILIIFILFYIIVSVLFPSIFFIC